MIIFFFPHLLNITIKNIFLILLKIIENIHWNWTATGVIASSIIATGTLMFSFVKSHLENKYKRSQFYLEQIKTYFNRSLEILINAKNNNIKWHQSIELLKTATSLSLQLTENEHKHIYFTDFIDVGYEIFNYITQHKDYRFFFGLSNYLTENHEILFLKSTPEKLEYPCTRISPDSLLYLCKFIDKVARANYEFEEGSSWEKCFESDYFQAPIDDNYQISGLISPSIEPILKYIRIYNEISAFEKVTDKNTYSSKINLPNQQQNDSQCES